MLFCAQLWRSFLCTKCLQPHILWRKSHPNLLDTVFNSKMATKGSKLHDKGHFFLEPLHQFPEQQYVYFLQLPLLTCLWTADPTSILARPCTVVFINFYSCNTGSHGIKPICQITSSFGWFQLSVFVVWVRTHFCFRVVANPGFADHELRQQQFTRSCTWIGQEKVRIQILQQTETHSGFLRAMQFSYESEDGGGSTAKRHLGSGPEVHLKLLIPRYSTTIKLRIHLTFN